MFVMSHDVMLMSCMSGEGTRSDAAAFADVEGFPAML
jgi:hypothetical protein